MEQCLHCCERAPSFKEVGFPENVYCSHLCQAFEYIGVKRPRESEIDDLFQALSTLKAQKTLDVTQAIHDLEKILNDYLINAVINGWVGVVRDLIFNKGLDPNTRGDVHHEPLLMLATRYSKSSSNEEMVKLLLEHPKTDPNLKGFEGKTAFMLIDSGTLNSLKMMMADPRTNINLRDDVEGDTVLILVSQTGNIHTLEPLLEWMLTLSNIDVNSKNKLYFTALHAAILFSNTTSSDNCVSLLLNHPNIDPNVRNFQLDTPLHLAVYSLKTEDSTERSIELLLRHPKTRTDILNNDRQTAYDLCESITCKLLFRAHALAKTSLPYETSKLIAVREAQLKICTYFSQKTGKKNIMRLAKILGIPDEMTDNKSRDDLCLIVSDVIATGAAWDKERYAEAQQSRRRAMTSFAKGALLKPLNQVKQEIKDYFGISSINEMSAAQVWAIVDRFRTY